MVLLLTISGTAKSILQEFVRKSSSSEGAERRTRCSDRTRTTVQPESRNQGEADRGGQTESWSWPRP